MTDALGRQLQHDRLVELLAEMDASSSPIPDDVMEEARQLSAARLVACSARPAGAPPSTPS